MYQSLQWRHRKSIDAQIRVVVGFLFFKYFNSSSVLATVWIIQFNSFDSIKLPFLTPAAVCKNLFGCCGDSSLSMILDLSSKQTLTAMLRVRYVALTVWLYFYVKNRKRRFKKRPPLSPTFGGSAHIPNGHTVKLSKGNVFYRLYNEGADSFEAPFFALVSLWIKR